MKHYLLLLLLCVYALAAAQERHLQNIQQLTFGGDNAEAYFSPNSQMLSMQVTNPEKGVNCDQIYLLQLGKDAYDFDDLQLISTGLGRTTCSFFMPDGQHILYASTHEASKECPPPPAPHAQGKYLWPILPEFDIYVADLKGNIVRKLTDTEYYDAEAVVSPDGKQIAFTSTRSGDLELWIMNVDGSNLRQLTHEYGYDGGAFFSHDSKKLVFRSSRPKTEAEIKEYKELLKENLVAPTNMEIYTINTDGTDLRQVTNLGKANWAPYFHPSDEKIIFASNHHSTRGYDFQLFMIDVDGSNLQQISFESHFNAFPMFSPDGKKLVFSSNRNPENPRETNVFIADWVEISPTAQIQQQNLQNHIQFLASDSLQGRLTGSAGEALAANYLHSHLEHYNLQPLLENSFFQEFQYSVRNNPHDPNSTIAIEGKNVVAYLNNNSDKTILIGAHYDHIGRNERNNSTQANAHGMIHNGADDNASGVAAVLELARVFSQNGEREEANYIFAFFSGEEDGLMGSKALAAYLQEQKVPIAAMINLDMVGRMNERRELHIGGLGTSPVWSDLVERYKPAGVTLAIDSSGIGPSDHTSFYNQQIPVLFFFTGTHQDYHKPTDTEEKINYRDLRHITDYVYGITYELSRQQKDSIVFTPTAHKTERSVAQFKVTLGIMPSYADSDSGLNIDGVTEGRPAAKAGLQAGDVLTAIGSCEVKEVYSYMQCLSEFSAGNKTTLTYKRNGQKRTVDVQF
ncbi:MAG: M20/M25/M40 family metallo-hydrolase [Weeksellaceae bacterium]|nr:M20/M25/M40 family metallo-hydrolase [Weeksellaceae bacterium]